MKIETNRKRKYFVISDIHGHYDEMISSLNTSGYSENSEDILIVLGDMFDRGTQSREVLEYVRRLFLKQKCYVIVGNHEVFLLELIEGNFERVHFNINHNGFLETLKSFSNAANQHPLNLELVRDEIVEKYPYLYDWISGFPNYLELGNYILVHGGIDGTNGEWRKSSRRDFVWSYESILEPICNRIVVAGHQRTATINNKNCDYKLLFKTKPSEFGILYLDGKILIDGFVEVSKLINVLLIEE